MVKFRWFGQACFEIGDGRTVVTDPHDGDSVGLEAPDVEGDIITVSHDHYDHASGKDLVSKAETVILEGMESGTADDINPERFESYHDKARGSARGNNVIFKFELDGFRICHLGDLGHTLESKDVMEIQPIDVLLIPVGGKFTIDGAEAAELVEELKPRVVIPMHYEVEGLEVPISGPDQFLRSIGDGYKVVEKETLELDELPEEETIYVLECLA